MMDQTPSHLQPFPANRQETLPTASLPAGHERFNPSSVLINVTVNISNVTGSTISVAIAGGPALEVGHPASGRRFEVINSLLDGAKVTLIKVAGPILALSFLTHEVQLALDNHSKPGTCATSSE